MVLRTARAQGRQAVAHRAGPRRGAACNGTAPAAWASGSSRANAVSPGASNTSVWASRDTPAKAASVCSTSARPATGWYCLGTAVAGPRALARTRYQRPQPAKRNRMRHGQRPVRWPRHRGVVAGVCVHGRCAILKSAQPPPPGPRTRGFLHSCHPATISFDRLHGIALTQTRQTFHPAAAGRLGRRPAAGAPGPGRTRQPGRLTAIVTAQAADAQRLLDEIAVLCARPALRHVPGLGDPALRHLLAAPGPDQRTPGHLVAHFAPRPGQRRRPGADSGGNRPVPAGAAGLPGRLHLPIQAAPEARRGAPARPADAGRLQPCQPGREPGRIRGARQPDRPVPDGLAGALPGRPVRRRDRQHPHLRPGQPAQPVSGARGPPAAGARISDGRRRPRAFSQPLARTARR